MPEAHRGLSLTDAHFDALVEDLVASLDAHRVPAREKGELLSALGGMRGEIVRK
jgi:hemoglobin